MKIWNPLYKIEEAEWIIIGVPFSGKTTALKGCEKAPDYARKCFKDTWTYDINAKRDLFDEKIVDVGNVRKQDLFKKLSEVKKKNEKAKILIIGGDHSITPVAVNALRPAKYSCFDAHFDLIDKYNYKDSDSHACANRRVYEMVKNVEILGVRTAHRDEHEFALKTKIVFSDKIRPVHTDYLSIDVDVLDPIYMGTGTPEPLGVTFEALINCVRHSEAKYYDIMEWIPPQGYPYITRLVKEILLK